MNTEYIPPKVLFMSVYLTGAYLQYHDSFLFINNEKLVIFYYYNMFRKKYESIHIDKLISF
ncbi:hypothetical protein GCM10008904_04130 [Paraclostridium ghonii]